VQGWKLKRIEKYRRLLDVVFRFLGRGVASYLKNWILLPNEILKNKKITKI
jgi:hypothetical protein